MALQSQLMRGDPRLEAAAVSDSAHIAQGAVGDHVRKIQFALSEIDGFMLTVDGIYGQGTAAAVLSYKTKRNIINRSYQSSADSVVGKMTIASLDRDMQSRELDSNSGSVSPCCVKGKRSAAPPSSNLILAFSVGEGGPQAGDPRQKALDAAKVAQNWIGKVLNALQLVGNKLRTGLTADLNDLQSMPEFQILEDNFHLSRGGMGSISLGGALPGLPVIGPTTALSGVLTIGAIYRVHQRILARGDEFFKNRPQPGGDPDTPAQTPDQGSFQTQNAPNREIQFFPAFLNFSTARSQPFVVLHEVAHFSFSFIDHFAHAPMGDGPAGPPYKMDTQGTVKRTKKYGELTFLEALQNADCYAQCAMQMTFGKGVIKQDDLSD